MSPVSLVNAASDLDADYGAGTTILVASNGVNTSTFAGSGTLNVAATLFAPSAGTLTVATGGTPATITYTGKTTTTFTGCTTTGGGGVLATGGTVFYTMYAALTTAAPDPTGNSGNGTMTEPNTSTQYGAYARVAIINNPTNWPAATGGAKANGTAITFPTSTGGASSPVTVTHLALVTGAAGTFTIIDYLALPAGTSVASGGSLSFPIGSVVITEA